MTGAGENGRGGGRSQKPRLTVRYGRPVAVKLTKYELEKMFKRA